MKYFNKMLYFIKCSNANNCETYYVLKYKEFQFFKINKIYTI